MNNKFDKAKRRFESIEIPEELNEMVNKTIKESNDEKIRVSNKPKKKNKIKIAAIAGLVAGSVFVLGLNTSAAFAKTVYEAPIIGSIAKVLTFVDYNYSNDIVQEEISIPKVEGLKDKEFEGKINSEIEEKMKLAVKEAEERAEEFKKEFLETGGTEEEYEKRKINIKVDYEIKAAKDDVLSFVISSFDSIAAAYAEYNYYNINLETDEIITLESIFGPDYVDIISTNVLKQIEEQKNDETKVFFEGENGFKEIREDIDFYINEDKNAVIVFDKYEIAPGAMGRIEFEIITSNR
ncbi:DUF3298 and DUF4163 domain-containing protein [Oceanirhabdus sp. W0125-5]|uniref:DUF3298 and DUF4163 domain-containing protein n=1 Tax=Oceanirhabdus sp. W0125-5 TaxID=2999116 RepID=UPI0022F3299C|nr:DUF3298 and DUF4163 domain-containing protein [Oceanirhabdus sp. W0125-5]WBW97416.1 DUF3298 and DUF4163 domain-containing protein [Oceanirhabdus sp. W0125-5]